MLLGLNLVKQLCNEVLGRELSSLTLNAGSDGNTACIHLVLSDNHHVGNLGELSFTDTITKLFISVIKLCANAEILENVIKTDYWDIDAMADAIYSITHNQALYDHLRIEGEAEVNEIKWKYAGQKVINIYNDVLKRY